MGISPLRGLFIAGIALLTLTAEARADKRVALVIGNSAYQNVAKLPNPSNDARAVADLLKQAGFDLVALQQDAGNLEFKRAIRKFEDSARDSDVAVIYYAGHGFEIGGVNYMIPVDAKLASDLDAPDEAIALDRIVESVGQAKQLGLVILDACRDNPFVSTMKRERPGASRGVSAGLAKIEPTSSGTLVAYAARAGSTADDGVGGHSPFTSALLHNMAAPGLDIRLAFGRVRDEVLQTTSQRQEPFVYGSLGGATVSLVHGADVVPPPPSQASSASDGKSDTDPNSAARRDYEYFERVGTKDAWDAFLKMYTTGPYADLARAQRAKLATQSAPPLVVTAVTPPSQSAPKTVNPLAGLAPGDVARMLQTELVRVGCFVGPVSGEWGPAWRRALDAYNRNANTKFDSSAASADALQAVRDKQARVCPLECDRGYHADGDTCVRIACQSGYAADDRGNCEPVRQPQTTTRTPAPEPQRQPPPARQPPTTAQSGRPPQTGGQGQVACDRFSCKPVGKNCHVETTMFKEESQQTVVCN